MQTNSLRAIFEATKGELTEVLSEFFLPKDAEKVQNVIVVYLNKVCDENSDYRQNLTQSEDYILQAALSLLNAQRNICAAFDIKSEVKPEAPANEPEERKDLSSIPCSFYSTINPASSLIGAGGGALVGKVLLGGWGAVFGAIAGTAIALYVSQAHKPSFSGSHTKTNSPLVTKSDETPVDVAALLDVIAQLCDSLDSLIATFRAQINRVINKYESQEKPTIEREYRVLLEGIQSLIGYKRGHSSNEEKYLDKLQTRVEDLAELLDNYDLVAVDFTPEHADWFEAIESNNATQVKLVNPAIVKGDSLVLKGKIFVPKD